MVTSFRCMTCVLKPVSTKDASHVMGGGDSAASGRAAGREAPGAAPRNASAMALTLRRARWRVDNKFIYASPGGGSALLCHAPRILTAADHRSRRHACPYP